MSKTLRFWGRWTSVFLVLPLLCFTGCGTNGPKYMLITNGVSPFWDAMVKGMQEEAKQLHVNADWRGPNPSENTVQIQMFNDALAAHVDGIGLSAIDPNGITPTINKAVDSGLPVICFDSDAPNSKRLAYLGTNNYEAGYIAGKAALKLFPHGGKLVAFVGTMSQDNARQRYNGFLDAIKGSNVQFIAPPYQDNQDKGMARSNVQDAITRYMSKGLNGLVGLYSYNGPAIIAALQAQNLRSKFKVICFDGDPATLKGLQQGMVDLTVVQKPFQFGRLSIELLNLLHQNHNNVDSALHQMMPELESLGMKVDMQKHTIDTGVTVVTPENAESFINDLHAHGLSST
ncbi:sugar-binding protein [Chthonomonas calidirosea]|uniref:sugar-binding protein n=1 Tax=Chthonomonas calidirosea TaxID=454171 RepID=UPI0006EC6C46|nr:sugar-binding protein [Chthonomonas calidirosea]CEK13133.1 monosaccharide ABC transporter substrate-binding protein, CUT2 family [Chthonomonas calidirosea]